MGEKGRQHRLGDFGSKPLLLSWELTRHGVIIIVNVFCLGNRFRKMFIKYFCPCLLRWMPAKYDFLTVYYGSRRSNHSQGGGEPSGIISMRQLPPRSRDTTLTTRGSDVQSAIKLDFSGLNRSGSTRVRIPQEKQSLTKQEETGDDIGDN